MGIYGIQGGVKKIIDPRGSLSVDLRGTVCFWVLIPLLARERVGVVGALLLRAGGETCE